MSRVSRHRRFIRETGLPGTARVFGEEDARVQYSGAFQRAFRSLGCNERQGVFDAIQLLAREGARVSKKKLQHKSLPTRRGVMPKGCHVSTPGRSKSIRFAWSYTKKKTLLLHFVGTHDKFWDSEG